MNIQQIQDLYNLCEHIRIGSSILHKKDMLELNLYYEDFLKLLEFLYDPSIVTGISNSKLNKKLPKLKSGGFLNLNKVEKFDSLFGLLDYIKIHNTGTDSDIRVCQTFIEEIDDEDLKFFVSKIITKSLKLGMDLKIIHSVYGNDFIKVHEVQQARSYKDVKLQDNCWICLSQKMNGNRATYIRENLISRQGREFKGLEHIIEDLKTLSNTWQNYVFDGEIILDNDGSRSDMENFSIGTGILNSDDKNKTQLKFVIFDMLPLEEFESGESEDTYKKRYENMLSVNDKINELNLHSVEIVPFLYSGTDHSMIEKCLNLMDMQGKEGCMLALDETYKCKRHNGLLKVKKFYNVDLEIVGFEAGSGKYENTLGSVIVKYKGNTVGVGSGFTDEQRDNFWNNREDLLGRVIEVKYKEITKDQTTGLESLQFPVFIQLREEGKKPSIY